ncbi:hypothetical protein [Motilibacter deserti]|uniref:Integral membrane protein n=1 Tax=Motilibacter deserti TaxID=2714956 RepID=A0ABX0GQL6_9ACTN|nr:hypothetical protein [Motilibacter deserti]NHC13012.1 hypothetical protein [Motilibacter deserti]
MKPRSKASKTVPSGDAVVPPPSPGGSSRPAGTGSSSTGLPRPTRGLLALAACVALEGLALVGVGAVVLVDAIADGAGNPLFWAFLIALFLLYGGVLLAAARAVLRRRRWARAPAVLSSLLALPVGWDAMGQDEAWLGVPVLVLGVLGLVLALAPGVGGLLTGERGVPQADPGGTPPS